MPGIRPTGRPSSGKTWSVGQSICSFKVGDFVARWRFYRSWPLKPEIDLNPKSGFRQLLRFSQETQEVGLQIARVRLVRCQVVFMEESLRIVLRLGIVPEHSDHRSSQLTFGFLTAGETE